MGGGGYTKKAWTAFSTSRGYDDDKITTADIYRSGSLDESLDPLKFDMRESTDGVDNPESTPIIIALDVTGSMGSVLKEMARNGLKTVCEEIYNRKPVTDPHICVLGIGDTVWDHSPFQATQFEADVRIFEQLEKLYLEMGGGGNAFESYILAWYFAHFRTKTDSFKKRGRKGYIFTLGDEEITPSISGEHLSKFMGDKQARDYTAQELLELIYPEWNVYHIIVKEGSNARYESGYEKVAESWTDVLGQNTIPLDDHKAMGETIVSLIEVSAGRSIRDVSESWDGSKSVTVGSALKHLSEVKEADALAKAL